MDDQRTALNFQAVQNHTKSGRDDWIIAQVYGHRR
jgi:hypothetical protein